MAGGAHDGQRLAGRHLQVDVLQYRARTPGIVGKPHAAERHHALRRRQALRTGRVHDLGARVQQQENALRAGRPGGVALEQVAQLLQRAEEQHHVEQAFDHLPGRERVQGQPARPGEQQHGHAGAGQHGRERQEPARTDAVADERPAEVPQQHAVAGAVGLLLPGLLQHLHARHRLHQVRGEAAAVLGDARPARLRAALEGPHGQQQQRHDGQQAQEERGRDAPQQYRRQAATQQGREQLRRALDQQRLQRVHVAVGARDDAPGLGAVEVAQAQRLHVREHLHPQRIQHRDGGLAPHVLGRAREQEPRHPAQRQAQGQPADQARVHGPAARLPGQQAPVHQHAHEPGPREHRAHQQHLEAGHQRDLAAHGPQQRQQPVHDDRVERPLGQSLFDLDVAHRLARQPAPALGAVTGRHGPAPSVGGSPRAAPPAPRACHWLRRARRPASPPGRPAAPWTACWPPARWWAPPPCSGCRRGCAARSRHPARWWRRPAPAGRDGPAARAPGSAAGAARPTG